MNQNFETDLQILLLFAGATALAYTVGRLGVIHKAVSGVTWIKHSIFGDSQPESKYPSKRKIDLVNEYYSAFEKLLQKTKDINVALEQVNQELEVDTSILERRQFTNATAVFKAEEAVVEMPDLIEEEVIFPDNPNQLSMTELNDLIEHIHKHIDKLDYAYKAKLDRMYHGDGYQVGKLNSFALN